MIAAIFSAALAPTIQTGFQPIFNGKDLSGWTPKITGHPLGENFANTFRIQDGTITVSYEGYKDGFQDKFGHLFYKSKLKYYILRLEYRFISTQCPGGPGWAYKNSGIMYHGQPANTMTLGQSFPVSGEFQFLGADPGQTRGTGNLCTPGTHILKDAKTIRQHVIEVGGPSLEGEQWVKAELEVNGHHIIHRINGKEVYRYQHLVFDPKDADAKRILPTDSLEITSGTISLQSESHPIQFRNIELKEL